MHCVLNNPSQMDSLRLYVHTYATKCLTQGQSPPSRWSKDNKQDLHLSSIHEHPRASGVHGGVSENGAPFLSVSSPWKSKVQQIHLLIHSFNKYVLNIHHVAAMVLGAEKTVENKTFLAHKDLSLKMTESENKQGMASNIYLECGQFSRLSLLPP